MCHTWTLWSVDMQDIICVRPDQRVLESWTFVKFLQIHNRERLCLKPLPQFSSNPNETCYIKSLWRCSSYTFLRPDIWVPKLCPFLKFQHFHNRESLCLKLLPQFQVLPMKLATSNPHEESMFITSFLWGLTQRLQSDVPFFKTLICAYWEGVSIFFHSFQVKNMIFWLFLAYFLWQSGKRGYIYHNEW